MTVQIHGIPQSSYVRTARMACAIKGVDHELVPVELGSDSHRKLHPFAKVPALTHEGRTIYETSAIARYVDAAFEGPALMPKGAGEAAVAEQWISAVNCYLYADFVRDYGLKYIFGGETPDRATIDATVPKLQRDLDLLEKALEGQDYLAGDALSLADLFVAPPLLTTQVGAEAREALGSRPNVQAWVGRLMQNPVCAEYLAP